MPSGGSDRRIATALFLDIVGSTAIASDLGDRRWRDLLTRFRGIVRTDLKRFGGREEGTAGDGFFATFTDPDRAVRCAAAIASDVHAAGLEIRCGIHTGGVETIDGTLGGIAVHIASRVMSLAGAAEVLVTSTVRDLIVGTPIDLEDFSLHELKGVPGTWQIFAVREIEGKPLAQPLEAGDAAGRIAEIEPAPFYRRRPRVMVAGGAILAVAAIGAIALVLVAHGGGGTTTMVEIDPSSGSTIRTIHDDAYSHHLWGVLRIWNGTMWQATPSAIVRRNLQTGAIEQTIHLGTGGLGPADGGAGSIFVATPYFGSQSSSPRSVITRYDQVSGDERGQLVLDGEPVDLRFGNGALWFLTQDGTLTKIDPLRFKVEATYATNAFEPGVVVPIAGYVWICECDAGKVIQFDPRSEQVVRTLTLAQKGRVFGVDSIDGTTVWLLDPGASTLTPIDPSTGKAGRPIGVPAQITDATIASGSIWVASPGEIRRIDLRTSGTKPVIEVPDDVSAGSIAVDPQNGDLWVANCGCPR
jgi:class 3 adenylate cyclase